MYIPQSSRQTVYTVPKQKPQYFGQSSASSTSRESSDSSNGSLGYSSTSPRPRDAVMSNSKNTSVSSRNPLPSPKIQREAHSPLPRAGSDSYSYRQQSPNQSPGSQRRNSPSRYNRSPRGSVGYLDRSTSPSPTRSTFDYSPRSGSIHSTSSLLSPHENSSLVGRTSPRPDRGPSPLSFNHPTANTLPRNVTSFRQPGEFILFI